ncbi:MAG TPA: tRNA-dependent cyclodipeptide synthase [Candidatus Sulfotelmatobacter sp.]
MNNSAFVGVSLDSASFSREWVRAALHHLLSQHDSLLLVLADQLLAYNKTAVLTVSPARIDLETAKVKIDQRCNDISTFLRKEIAFLDKGDRERVHIARWEDFSDASYSKMLRELRIAYSAIEEFRCCVDHDASFHFERHLGNSRNADRHHELCVSYVLDETAMDIRITELAGYSFEYYPEDHIRTLTHLYEDRFANFGLTVSKLVGQSAKRVFQPFYLASRPQTGKH